jgi:hypothetical protein
MINSTFEFNFNDLRISASRIETVLGYKEGEDRELVTGLIYEILEEAGKICNIKAQYTIFHDVSFEKETKSILVEGLSLQVKKIVFTQIKKSDSIAIFLCTAGKEIGIRSREYMAEKDLLKGFVYDIIGSEIVEAAADLMQAELGEAMIRSGKKITNRYSPGYCGWDVADQHNIFKLVNSGFCGIRLTESALMDPVKSISGIIGIGKDVKLSPYTCKMCNMTDCIYRRIKEIQ